MLLLADNAFQWVFDQLKSPLVIFGFAAQAVFMGRFVVQWFASERRGRSYVPVAFWWLSLTGGLMLFIYACFKADLVFMGGQLLGVAIYVRNLALIYGRQARYRARRTAGNGAPLADVDPESVPPQS